MSRSLVVWGFFVLTTAFGATQLNGQASQVSVTTWRNDNWRTAQNTSETTFDHKQLQPQPIRTALQDNFARGSTAGGRILGGKS